MKQYHRFPGNAGVIFCETDIIPENHDGTGPWECYWCVLGVPLVDELTPWGERKAHATPGRNPRGTERRRVHC